MKEVYAMRLLAKISSYFPSLTKSEQKVAQYILINPDEIETISIQELAKNVKVGESTIVRFTRKVGFKGFPEFKLALLRDQMQENNVEDKGSGVIDMIHHQLLENLKETQHFLKDEEFKLDEVAKKIFEADCVYIFAGGNSGAIAEECSNRFIRIGKKAVFHADSHNQAIYASVMTKKDIALAITVSGNTKDILMNLSIASNSGAEIVAITNYLNSGVSKLTNNVIICSSKEYSSVYGSVSSKVSQLFAIDVLLHKLIDLDKQQIQDLRNKTNKALIARLDKNI